MFKKHLSRLCIFSSFALFNGVSQAGLPAEQDPAAFQGVIGETSAMSKPGSPARTAAAKGAPNILVWMIDDAGFGQLHSYGGLIDTPTTDQLAQQGLRFNNFHTAALCSATRASFLTGRNSHAVSVGGHSGAATDFPGYWSRVPKSAATIAKVLQGSGYTTYALGKWDHLPGEDISPAGPFTYWPTGQGFDHFYGFMAAEMGHYQPTMWADQTPVDPWRGKSDYYLTTDLADHAVEWIKSQKAVTPERPFFMYWATGAVHAPHQALKSAIEKYRGKFDMGWDKARELILSNQKKLGIIPAYARLPQRPPGLDAWDSLSPEDKKVAARQMEAFAAELDIADKEFGRIVDTLKETGQYDNTIIVVLSDNGASGEGGPEGLFNEMYLANAEITGYAINRKFIDQWGGPGTHPHYSAAWANAGNTPFKYYKQTVHEGGSRDPLIISWPKGISGGGGIRGQYQHVSDIMPTLLDLAGIPQPKEVDGVPQQRMDGISMRYAIADPKAPTQKGPQYYEMWGNRGIWSDGWVAVTAHNLQPWFMVNNKPVENDVWELYDLNHDLTEMHDLAVSKPEKLAEMKKLFDIEAKRNNAYPIMPDVMQKKRIFMMERLKQTGGIYEYSGTVRRVPVDLAPPILNHSYSITARITPSSTSATGAIVAEGGEMVGYALYLKDGKPAFVYNHYALDYYQIKSPEALPAGTSTVRFEFRKTGKGAGYGALYVGDKKVAEGPIAHTVPFRHSTTDETFDVGRDDGTQVSPEYEGHDIFPGKIDKVTFKIEQ